MAQFPSPRIAELSYDFRTLGLGYANIGGLLMTTGCPTIRRGPRPLRRDDRGHDRRVLRRLGRDGGRARRLPGLRRERRAHAARHPQPSPRRRRATRPNTKGSPSRRWRSTTPAAPTRRWSSRPRGLGRGARGRRADGYRNAQTTLLAPTGTIGLLMDCDTTGVEPDFALVKFKKLAGGGYFKIANQAMPRALTNLGYTPGGGRGDRGLRRRHGSLEGARHQPRHADRPRLRQCRDRQDRGGAAGRLRDPLRLQPWTLGEELCTGVLGIPAEKLRDPGFELLRHLGFARVQIEAANEHICGTMTIEARRTSQRALRRLRLRQQVRQEGHPLSLGQGPHPDDGRRPELPLRRHLQDDQHAERGDHRGHQGGLRAPGRSASRRWPSIATAPSCRSRSRRR